MSTLYILNVYINFQCDASWSTDIFDTFQQYVDGKRRALTTGYGIGIGPDMGGTVLDRRWFTTITFYNIKLEYYSLVLMYFIIRLLNVDFYCTMI